MARIGISGWSYAGWRGDFYPKGLRQRDELAYAAERMSSVEINGSFYSLQRPEHYARWRDEAPDHFVFSVKAPRFITHMLKLRDSEQALVAVAEVECGVAREAVEVAPAVDVGHPRAGRLHDHDGKRVVVVRRAPLHLLDGGLRGRAERIRGHRRAGHRRSSSVQHLMPPPPSSSSERSRPIVS